MITPNCVPGHTRANHVHTGTEMLALSEEQYAAFEAFLEACGLDGCSTSHVTVSPFLDAPSRVVAVFTVPVPEKEPANE